MRLGADTNRRTTNSEEGRDQGPLSARKRLSSQERG